MISHLLKTDGSWVTLFVRVTLGAVMLPHGLQKTLGWFGGSGFSASLSGFSEHLGIPVALAVLVIAAESLGALGLVTGFLTRISALGIFAVMIGAIFMAHLPNGFFMNWSGSQAGEGIEYHLLVLGMSAALVVGGGGLLSIDVMLSLKCLLLDGQG